MSTEFDPDAFERALEAKAAASPSLGALLQGAEGAQLLVAAVGVVLLALEWRRRRAEGGEPPPGPPEPAWGIPTAIAMLVLLVPVSMVGFLAARALLGTGDPFWGSELLHATIGSACIAPAAIGLARWSGAGLAGIGLGPAKGARGSLATGLRCWLMGFPLFTAAHLVAGKLFESLGRPKEANVALERFILGENRAELAWIAFYAIVIAPVCEELVFRGILFPAFRRRLGFGGGALVAALFFTLVHPGMDMGGIFVLALFLALAYERAGSLRASIVAHAANNAFAMAVLCVQRYIHHA